MNQMKESEWLAGEIERREDEKRGLKGEKMAEWSKVDAVLAVLRVVLWPLFGGGECGSARLTERRSIGG